MILFNGKTCYMHINIAHNPLITNNTERIEETTGFDPWRLFNSLAKEGMGLLKYRLVWHWYSIKGFRLRAGS